MKKSTVSIIVALCLIVAGIAIVCAAFAMADFSFEGFASEQFEDVTYTVEGDFDHIVIATEIHGVTLAPSEDSVCRIVGSESKNYKIEYEIEGNTLEIKVRDGRNWYEYIGIFVDKAEITLYLPKSVYTSLTVAVNTGDVIIPDTFTFTGVSVATSTGAVEVRKYQDRGRDRS